VRVLVLVFLIPLALITLILFACRTVMHIWGVPGIEKVKVCGGSPEEEHITEAVMEDVSKNLIYCVDDETGEINKVVLEILNCKDKRLYYITIPVRTRFTMSGVLYQKLTLVDPKIPQVIKLSALKSCFDDDTVYDYGVLIVQDLLGIDISYYTAVSQRIYEGIFFGEEQEEEDISKEAFSEDYIELLQSIKTKDELKKYISKIYPSLKSNLTLYQKMNYFESYCQISMSNIFFEVIAGENKNCAYIINQTQAAQQIDAILIGN
jgi:hypothetical protein